MASAHPLTPEPIEYAVIKTPRSDDLKIQTPSPSWASKYWYLGSLAQLIAFGSLALYIVTAVIYLTPYYFKLDAKLAVWWGVPSQAALKANPKMSKGHGEMTLPTYLFLGLFAPLLLAMVAVPFLRSFNVRRITSRYLLNAAMVLRRKPFVFGKLSYFGYGELLFLVVFLLGGNVLVSWYQYDAYIAYIVEAEEELTLEVYLGQIGLLLGYTCVWNMAFLFLPATRNCVWMELLGISYANGIKYHRWAGVVVVLTGVGHTVPYYWMWAREHRWLTESLPCFDCKVDAKSDGRHIWFNVYGELALLCFLAIAVGSLPIVRRRLYESFYYVHHLFIPGVLFTVLHWVTTTWFIFPSFLIYLIDRAVSSSSAFWPVQVHEFSAQPDGIIKIVIARSPHDDGSYKIGQFVYLNVPAISKLQWHPFTIASSPKTSADSLTILLKSLGDWTADLKQYAEDCHEKNELPTLYMDGYYGESLDKYVAYPSVCLVGGGIGVTPIRAILEDMAATLSHHEAPSQRVHFVFTFRELSLLEELHPVLATLRELDPQGHFFTYHFYLTRAPVDSALDQPIDFDRIQGQSHGQLTKTSASTVTGTTPFAEPLRTRGFRAVMYLVIIFLAVFFVAWLEFDNGRIVKGGEKSQLWMAQYFVEISVLFLCTLVVYAVILAERLVKQRNSNTSALATTEKDMSKIPDVGASDLHSLRDLLAAYDVTLGCRPDMDTLMQEVSESHEAFAKLSQSGQGAHANRHRVIGVFMSGPEALKTATEYAIAKIGSHRFDVHAEEFEL